jgi:hypothetical protein
LHNAGTGLTKERSEVYKGPEISFGPVDWGYNNMHLRNTLVVLGAIALSAGAHAQTPIGPFIGLPTENFNTIPMNVYPSFVGFSGNGLFTSLNTGGAMFVQNTTLLPPITGNSMFGRGTDVRIQFSTIQNRFGGFWRVAGSGIVVTGMTVRFLRLGSPVGFATAPINMASWQWRGWNLTSLGGYDEVQIFGNGAQPCYVGMENLRRG